MAEETPRHNLSLLEHAFNVLAHTLNEQIKDLKAFFSLFLLREKVLLASGKGNKST